MEEARKILRNTFGLSEFRGQQEACIKRLVVDGKNALAIMPTGSGKSLCYQLPSLMFPGLTLVISPLIALMKDQVDSLVRKGIKAGRFDSSQSNEEYRETVDALRDGSLRLLYVAPERLNMEGFMALIAGFDIELLAVDEAHCVSEWGASFRPDYLKIARFVGENRVKRVLCLTATATESVTFDIAAAFSIDIEDAIFRVPSYRHNLTLDIVSIENDHDGTNRIDRCAAIIRASPGPTIIYITTQKHTEQVSLGLVEKGIDCRSYHAGMDAAARKSVQEWFMTSSTACVCATIAFGMGIDKPDIRNVIHFNLPKTLEGYSQEVGRAGRDGKPSTCTLFLFAGDRCILESFARGNSPSKTSVRKLVQRTCLEAIEQGVKVGEMLQINSYELSREYDVREVAQSLLFASLELTFGYLRAGTPIYAVYDYNVPDAQKYEQAKADSSPEGKAIRKHATFGRTKYTVNVEETARLASLRREDIIRKLNQWNDSNWIKLSTSQRRNMYRILKPLPRTDDEINEMADSMFDEMMKREEMEVKRVQQVLEWASVPKCLANNLARHFGDYGVFKGAEGCGHCTVCKQGGKPAIVYDFKPPKFDEGLFAQVLAAVPVRDDARYLTRVAFGITSPRTTKEGTSKLAVFGLMYDHSWDELLKRCEEESDKWWKENPDGPAVGGPTNGGGTKRKAAGTTGGPAAKRGKPTVRGYDSTAGGAGASSSRGRGRGRGRGY